MKVNISFVYKNGYTIFNVCYDCNREFEQPSCLAARAHGIRHFHGPSTFQEQRTHEGIHAAWDPGLREEMPPGEVSLPLPADGGGGLHDGVRQGDAHWALHHWPQSPGSSGGRQGQGQIQAASDKDRALKLRMRHFRCFLHRFPRHAAAVYL